MESLGGIHLATRLIQVSFTVLPNKRIQTDLKDVLQEIKDELQRNFWTVQRGNFAVRLVFTLFHFYVYL